MNKELLEYEMKRKQVSRAEICKTLKIAPSSFYRKCNGITDFTVTEVRTIIDLLKIEDPVPIFFAD